MLLKLLKTETQLIDPAADSPNCERVAERGSKPFGIYDSIDAF
jgi:hypothetical protein